MSNGDEECDIRPGTVTPKKLPKQGGGGGHEFVTELPEVGEEGIEYVLMDDISDCSTYKGTYAWSPECEAYVCTSGSGGGAVERYTFEQTATGWRAKRNNTVIFTYVDRDTIDSYENTATGFKIIRGGSVIFEHTDGGGGDCPEYTAESTPTGWQLLKDGVVIFTYVDKNDEYIIESTVDGWVFKENGVVKFTYTEPADDPSDGTYFTSGTLTTVIAGTSTVAASSVTGLTLADVVIGETLIYDEFGSVGRVTAVSGTNLTVETITTAPGERRGTRLGAVDDYTDLPATCADATALGWQTPLAGDFAYVREDASHDDHLTEWVISAIDGSCNITWAYSHTLNAGNYVLDIYKYGDYPSGNPIPKNADGSVTLPKDEDTKYDFESTADGWRVKDHDTGTVLYTYVDVDTDTKYDFEDVTSSGVVVGWRVKDHDTGTVLYTHTDVGDTTYDFEAVTVGGNIVGWRVKDGDTGTVLFTYTDLNDESDGTYFTSDTLDTDITDQTTVASSTVTGLTLSDVVIGETLIYDGAGTVGVVTAVSGTDLIVDTITTSGSGDASSYVYKTTGTFDTTVDNTTNVNLSTLTDASGNTPTASDIIIGKTLAWDDDGTVALAVAISGSSVTFKTMTLSGGGSGGTYVVDMDGEYVKSATFKMFQSGKADTPDGGDYGIVTVARNAIMPFTKQSGDFEAGSTTGTFKVPAGMRIETNLHLAVTGGATGGSGVVNVRAWLYNVTDGAYCKGDDNNYLPSAYNYNAESAGTGGAPTYHAFSRGSSLQWTNNTGHTVELGFRCTAFGSTTGMPAYFRTDATSLTVKEIGRVVDPVKYLDNSEGLQDTPVGNIISYMGNNVPRHYLACDGTVYNIGDYPALEAHFIEEFGSVNYFGGNGTTTWAVPDLQGEFLRGTGTNSHANQGSGANVGIHQDATKHFNVQEEVTDALTSINVTGTTTNYDSATSVTSYRNKYARTGYDPASTVFNSYITSRPTNTSVKYCIKYESTMQVILGNEQYKVNVSVANGGSKTWNSYGGNNSGQIGKMTVLHGDSSMISSDGLYFTAPVDGWYEMSADMFMSTKSGSQSGWIWFFKISDNNRKLVQTNTLTLDNTANNATPSSELNSAQCAGTVYLAKGDQVQLGYWRSANDIVWTNMKASFVLLTSSVDINEVNLIASNEIYSTDEQLVGSYMGKPLYKKSYTGLSVNVPNDTWYNVQSVSSLGIERLVKSEFLSDQNGTCHDGSLMGQINSGYLQAWSPAHGVTLSVATIYYTKTTDAANSAPTKNMLLINRPDLWTVGTEYDFGGGLYGKRLKGTATGTNLLGGNIIICSGVAKTAQVINKGGMVDMSGTAGTNWYDINGVWNSGDWFRPLATNTSQVLRFYCANNQGITSGNIQYDVWFTYTKA